MADGIKVSNVYNSSALVNPSFDFTLTAATAYVFADISWKQIFRALMPHKKITFLPTKTSGQDFIQQIETWPEKTADNPLSGIEFYFFKFDVPDSFLEYAKTHNIKIQVIEPGFIRSIYKKQTNAPFSLVTNSDYSIHNYSKTSELEKTLQNFSFEEHPDLIERAKANINYIISNQISAYNSGIRTDHLYSTKNKHRVLVIEQPLNERQKNYSMQKDPSSLQMLSIARIENPDAEIIYKCHPDNHNNLPSIADRNTILEHANIIIENEIHVFSALHTIDHVYTITSHVGFEALLIGIKVSVFGRPWYSGWGLTDDREPINRKHRNLDINQLFAGAYILHSQYFDPLYKTAISLEQALSRIVTERNILMSNTIEEYLIKQANQVIKGLNPEEACTQIKDTLIKNKNSNKIRAILADLQVRLGQNSEAIATLDDAIQLDPKNSSLYLSRAKARLKNGEFSDETTQDFHQAIDHAKSKNELLYEYFNYIWEKEPISEATLKQFDAALEQTPALQKNSKPYGKLLLLKAAMLIETGQRSTAAKLHRQALALGAFDSNLLALRCNMRKAGNAKAATDAEMAGFEKLISYKDRFRELVLEANGSVCIVGNAPTLLGKKLGEMIDQNKLVVRFNSYNNDYPYSEDYGVKTDVWVRMPFHPYVRREPETSLKLVMFTGANRLYRSYTEWSGIFDYISSGLPVQFFTPNIFYELQKAIGAPPTAGLTMCYMLYKIIGPLRPEHYYGFSFTEDQAEPIAYHYSDQNATSSSRHHWDREAAFFQTIKAATDSEPFQPRSMLSQSSIQQQADPSSSSDVNPTVLVTESFDRVISVSPGLLDYSIYGQQVEGISGAKTERHLQWLENPEKGQAAELLTSITPDQKVCFLGFGRAKTGLLAEQIAKALNAEYRLVEYGLISSMHLPSEKKLNFSLILDSQGIFYDTTAPSLIENLLLLDVEILSAQMAKRAEQAMRLIVDHNVTKYNNSPDMVLPPNTMARHRILVIDQTAGDNSIIYGQCERFSFRDMLQHALQQPNSEVILKIHPETAAGAKDGNLTEIADLLENPNLHVIGQQCNIVSLIKQVDEVYVMTSGVGLEALIIGKPVRCFGVPFYSGWGLTQDMTMVENPRRPLTLHALFAATFIKYNHFYHPDSRQPCSLEACLQWIIANKPSLPSINMEWST